MSAADGAGLFEIAKAPITSLLLRYLVRRKLDPSTAPLHLGLALAGLSLVRELGSTITVQRVALFGRNWLYRRLYTLTALEVRGCLIK